MHHVRGGISEVHQRVLFICNADGDSDRPNSIDRLREKWHAEVNSTIHEHGQQHQARHSRVANRPKTLTVEWGSTPLEW